MWAHTVGVEYGCEELHLRRHVGVIVREDQLRPEVAACDDYMSAWRFRSIWVASKKRRLDCMQLGYQLAENGVPESVPGSVYASPDVLQLYM